MVADDIFAGYCNVRVVVALGEGVDGSVGAGVKGFSVVVDAVGLTESF